MKIKYHVNIPGFSSTQVTIFLFQFNIWKPKEYYYGNPRNVVLKKKKKKKEKEKEKAALRVKTNWLVALDSSSHFREREARNRDPFGIFREHSFLPLLATESTCDSQGNSALPRKILVPPTNKWASTDNSIARVYFCISREKTMAQVELNKYQEKKAVSLHCSLNYLTTELPFQHS